MERPLVYAELDRERDYQNQKWGGKTHDSEHEVAGFLVYMQHYLARAFEKATMIAGTEEALHEMRKVVALGVACFEIHGCPSRQVSLDGLESLRE